MSKGNWLKLHRELKDHWVHDKLEWLAGWIDILMSADWQNDGEVNLTMVPARLKFSKAGWFRFIKLLIEDGMLTEVETSHNGKTRGSTKIAKITNWHKYQYENNVTNAETNHVTNAKPQNPAPDAQNAISENQSETNHVTNAETQYKNINTKEGFKEYKENNIYNGDSENQNSTAFFQTFLPLQTVEWLDKKINLTQTLSIWGKENLIDLWRECFTLETRGEGDKPQYRFLNALQGNFETQTKPHKKPTKTKPTPEINQIWKTWDKDLFKIERIEGNIAIGIRKHDDGFKEHDYQVPFDGLLEYIRMAGPIN